MYLRLRHQIIFLLLLVIVNTCTVPYSPKTSEAEELMVIDGLITDQPTTNTVRLSKSYPLWKRTLAKPLKGCIVTISDDRGQFFNLKEIRIGTYITDSTTFQGVVGRRYQLHVLVPGPESVNYESFPIEMKPVPPIDSIYYEKRVYQIWPLPVEGCQIYLDAHDATNVCKFFRWDYTETWEFHIPFDVPNRICWISDKSDDILIKNTSSLSDSRIIKNPLLSISDPYDKLSVKYSMLLNQFSLNEDEYLYWDRLKNIIGQVGGLYDQVPAAIPNNVYSVENPNEKVLGYFSVCAKKTKRVFIQDRFSGLDTKYDDCVTDTVYGINPIPGLNIDVWVLIDLTTDKPPVRYVTNLRRCGDCTSRGTNIKPSFWK